MVHQFFRVYGAKITHMFLNMTGCGEEVLPDLIEKQAQRHGYGVILTFPRIFYYPKIRILPKKGIENQHFNVQYVAQM